MQTTLIIVGAYLLGSVSFAIVVSRALALPDPRSYGSKNPGATNVLRSGSRAAALSHLARSVCRRAERMLTTVANTETVNPETPKYLNRLSDLLFVIARFINRDSGHDDVLWQKDRPQPHI